MNKKVVTKGMLVLGASLAVLAGCGSKNEASSPDYELKMSNSH